MDAPTSSGCVNTHVPRISYARIDVSVTVTADTQMFEIEFRYDCDDSCSDASCASNSISVSVTPGSHQVCHDASGNCLLHDLSQPDDDLYVQFGSVPFLEVNGPNNRYVMLHDGSGAIDDICGTDGVAAVDWEGSLGVIHVISPSDLLGSDPISLEQLDYVMSRVECSDVPLSAGSGTWSDVAHCDVVTDCSETLYSLSCPPTSDAFSNIEVHFYVSESATVDRTNRTQLLDWLDETCLTEPALSDPALDTSACGVERLDFLPTATFPCVRAQVGSDPDPVSVLDLQTLFFRNYRCPTTTQEGGDETFTFLGEDSEENPICSAHGECVLFFDASPSPFELVGECRCSFGWEGVACEDRVRSAMERYGYAVIGSVGGTVAVVVVVVVIVVVVLLVVGISLGKKKGGNGNGNADGVQTTDLEAELGKYGKYESLLETFDPQLCTLDYDELTVGRKIGEGGSGAIVLLADYRGEKCVFKCFQLDKFRGKEFLREFADEVRLLLGCQGHPNVLRFIGALRHLPNRFGVVLEWCPNGDLADYLEKHSDDVSKAQRLSWLKQIADAMDFLHARIIHRDLKLENVLLDENLDVKIMDFGLSRFRERVTFVAAPSSDASSEHDSSSVTGEDDIHHDNALTGKLGTNIYMAPEMTLGREYNNKIDVFAFGMMMYLMLTGKTEKPYPGVKDFGIEIRVAADPGFRPKFSDAQVADLGDDVIDVIRRCWDHEASVRPTFLELKELAIWG